jgi:integrase
MASISKRTWRTSTGKVHSAWVVTYSRGGKEHRYQFPTKREADAERIRIEAGLSQGTHVPDGKSVREAAAEFLKHFEELYKADKKQRSTYLAYEEHVRLHMAKREIASTKLARLTRADCAKFADELQKELSSAMAHRVFGTFKTILRYSRAHEWILLNPAQEINIKSQRKKVQIPSKASLRRLLMAARNFDKDKMAEAFVSLLLFGGLRISELRAQCRRNVDIAGCRVAVRQRADCWRVIANVKTDAGNRTVPLPKSAIAAIAVWMSRAPKSDEDLLFPNGIGNVEFYQNFYMRFWLRLMLAAGLAKKIKDIDKNGRVKSRIRAEFGIHALRHAAISLWIEQGANPVKVEELAGHADVAFTLRVYGHLWADPAGDAQLAEKAAQSLAAREEPT